MNMMTPHKPKNQTRDHKDTINERAKKEIERFRKMARGVEPRQCSICGYFGKFTAFGNPPRIDAHCAGCGSLERHRLYALMIEREAPFGPQDAVLHFAAEHHLRKLVKPVVARYETAEIRASTNPTHVLNIEAIDLPESQYDAVICNHVLEHVDDAKALREMLRVLKPGGKAYLTTPVVEGWAQTYENSEIDGQAARTLHFGQLDHVRMFGRDIRDRIIAAGFELREYVATEPDVHIYGLMRGETIFIATRPQNTASKEPANG
jgi:SAM-dependent methyltransferase